MTREHFHDFELSQRPFHIQQERHACCIRRRQCAWSASAALFVVRQSMSERCYTTHRDVALKYENGHLRANVRGFVSSEMRIHICARIVLRVSTARIFTFKITTTSKFILSITFELVQFF